MYYFWQFSVIQNIYLDGFYYCMLHKPCSFGKEIVQFRLVKSRGALFQSARARVLQLMDVFLAQHTWIK